LTWLGPGSPRGDKVLTQEEALAFLDGEVLVEEKLDGANLGVSLSVRGHLCFQNRGQYLEEPYSGQFARLQSWLSVHEERLISCLKPDLIVFGEWCAAKHSLAYSDLPDWLLVFDVYDRKQQRFWSRSRREGLASELGMSSVPKIYEGLISLGELVRLLDTAPSRYRKGPPEGIVVRRDEGAWCNSRAKLVRSDFVQAIDSHWRSRSIEWNRLR